MMAHHSPTITTNLTEEEIPNLTNRRILSESLEVTVKEESQDFQFASEDISLQKDEEINSTQWATAHTTRSHTKKMKIMCQKPEMQILNNYPAKKRIRPKFVKTPEQEQNSETSVSFQEVQPDAVLVDENGRRSPAKENEVIDQEENSKNSEFPLETLFKSIEDFPHGDSEQIKEKSKVKYLTEVASAPMTRSHTKGLKSIGEEPKFQHIDYYTAKKRIRAKSLEVSEQEAEGLSDEGQLFPNLEFSLMKENSEKNFEKPLELTVQQKQGSPDIQFIRKEKESSTKRNDMAMQEMQESQGLSLVFERRKSSVNELEMAQKKPNLPPPEPVQEEQASQNMQFDPERKGTDATNAINVAVREAQVSLNIDFVAVQEEEQQELNPPPLAPVQAEQGSVNTHFSSEDNEIPTDVEMHELQESQILRLTPERANSPINEVEVAMQEDVREEEWQEELNLPPSEPVQEDQGSLDIVFIPERKESATCVIDMVMQEAQESENLSVTKFEKSTSPINEVEITVLEEERKEPNMQPSGTMQEQQGSLDGQINPEAQDSTICGTGVALQEVQESLDIGFVVVQEEKPKEPNLLPLAPVQGARHLYTQFNPEEKEIHSDVPMQELQESQEISLTAVRTNSPINEVEVFMQEEEMVEEWQQELNQPPSEHVQEEQVSLDIVFIPERKESSTYATDVDMLEVKESGNLSFNKLEKRSNPIKKVEMTMPEEQKEPNLPPFGYVQERQGSVDIQPNAQHVSSPERRNSFENKIEVAVQEKELQEVDLAPSDLVQKDQSFLGSQFYPEETESSINMGVQWVEETQYFGFTSERINSPINEVEVAMQEEKEQELNLQSLEPVQVEQGSIDMELNLKGKENATYTNNVAGTIWQKVQESLEFSLPSDRRSIPENEVKMAVQEENKEELSLPYSRPVQKEERSFDMEFNIKGKESLTYTNNVIVQEVQESHGFCLTSERRSNIQSEVEVPVQSPSHDIDVALLDVPRGETSEKRRSPLIDVEMSVQEDKQNELYVLPSKPVIDEQNIQFSPEGQESPTYTMYNVPVEEVQQSPNLGFTSQWRISQVNEVEVAVEEEVQQELTLEPSGPVQEAVSSSFLMREFQQGPPLVSGHSKGKPPFKRIVLKLQVPAGKTVQKRTCLFEQSNTSWQSEFRPTYKNSEIIPVGRSQIKGKPEESKSHIAGPPAHVTRSYTKEKRTIICGEHEFQKTDFYTTKKRTPGKPIKVIMKSQAKVVKEPSPKRKGKGKDIPLRGKEIKEDFKAVWDKEQLSEIDVSAQLITDISADVSDQLLEEYIIKLKDKPLPLLGYNVVCDVLKQLEHPHRETSSIERKERSSIPHPQYESPFRNNNLTNMNVKTQQKVAKPSQSTSHPDVSLDHVLDFLEDYADSGLSSIRRNVFAMLLEELEELRH